MRVKRLSEFRDWFSELTLKGQAQVDARLRRIEEHNHFGDAKSVGGGIAELRWKNGWRVYFALTEDQQGKIVLVILGGSKNGQSKDIAQARLLLGKYADHSS